MRVVIRGLIWVSLILSSHFVALGIRVLSSYTQVGVDPNTGQKTITYQFLLRCSQFDNAATFVSYNISWNTNQTSTNATIIKVSNRSLLLSSLG